MGVICKLVGHKWPVLQDGKKGCSCIRCKTRNYDGWHDWNGCTCKICGFINDDSFSHEWENIPGTCDCRCSICGKIDGKRKIHSFNGGCICVRCGEISWNDEDHKWKGCVCAGCGKRRNEAHDFVSGIDGRFVCSICGISQDESYAKAAEEMLEEAQRSRRDKERQELTRKAHGLIRQIYDPACIIDIISLADFCTLERLAELGADKELATIARAGGDAYNYELKKKAYSLIKDASLRDSISVRMTGMEAVWYDYDIKSGM